MAAPSQFRSKFKSMVVVARHGHDILHPVTGTKTGEVKRIAADFGVHSGEYTVIDPLTGKEETFADIRGYFYDLDADAKSKGWTEDEKEAMRTRLLDWAERWPEAVQIHSAIPTLIPFPTYDKVPAENVAPLAIDLGLAEQALAYEQENQNRPEVVAALQEALVAAPAESEELTAA